MLSDFDLAKQSSEPGGMPGMIHSEQNGVSAARRCLLFETLSDFDRRLDLTMRMSSLIDPARRHYVMYGQFPN